MLLFHTRKFLEKFRLHKLKNVSYSKLKWNTFSPLELFAELSQFLSAATKVSNKIRAVELTSMTNNLLGTTFLPGQVDSSMNYSLFACSTSFKEHKELGL